MQEKEREKEAEEEEVMPSLFDEAQALSDVVYLTHREAGEAVIEATASTLTRRSYPMAGWSGRKPKESLEDFAKNKWGKRKAPRWSEPIRVARMGCPMRSTASFRRRAAFGCASRCSCPRTSAAATTQRRVTCKTARRMGARSS